ncbi:hypothetical protein DBR00_19830 [Pseudomonas sp. HMWF032]|uniref:sugar transferase n=1 Tax=Pseudomonas sp. HMWF032 TaxID=2056866 RepID=UPI000D35CA12|nr:sugar transferase [Pseudomonas sp. HMWF032]PTS82353.1 hypothetical protein DBR00_19830 [Pseudomonas sp. HMWF032]PTT72722.1 hypothetical protein DBR41_29210 [Pseudomonas sp. HMWF010]
MSTLLGLLKGRSLSSHSVKVPASRYWFRGITVGVMAWLASELVAPQMLGETVFLGAMPAVLLFIFLDRLMLCPQSRLAERLATNLGQLLITLAAANSVAALADTSLPWLWSVAWLTMTGLSLVALEMLNNQVAAWRPQMPIQVIAGECRHASEYVAQQISATQQLTREQAVAWLSDEHSRPPAGQVLIFDACLQAPAAPTCSAADQHVPGTALSAAQKRLFDLMCASLLLGCCAPIMLGIAFIVRAYDGGPVIFRQKRLGLHGVCFTVLKFRSMRVSAGHDPLAPQAQNHDPRITPVGRWIRHWGLDELPQLLNVMRGDMSMVGPRPHAVAHDVHYAASIAYYNLRQAAKPGLTGLAQIRGRRGETKTIADMLLRVADDLEYISRQSVFLDTFIVLSTPLALLRGTAKNLRSAHQHDSPAPVAAQTSRPAEQSSREVMS